MLIFNTIQDLHSSDTYTSKIEIQWKEFKLSSRHRRWTDGQTDQQGESSIPLNFFAEGIIKM